MIKTIGYFVMGVCAMLIVTVFMSLPLQLLWNWVMPQAVHWAKEITWLEAWGLLILAYMLVKPDITVKRP